MALYTEKSVACKKLCINYPRCESNGDPHLTTFDGHPYDFQGGCNYTYAETCVCRDYTGTPAWFRVTARHNAIVGQGYALIDSIRVQAVGCDVLVDNNLTVRVRKTLNNSNFIAQLLYISIQINSLICFSRSNSFFLTFQIFRKIFFITSCVFTFFTIKPSKIC